MADKDVKFKADDIAKISADIISIDSKINELSTKEGKDKIIEDTIAKCDKVISSKLENNSFKKFFGAIRCLSTNNPDLLIRRKVKELNKFKAILNDEKKKLEDE